MARSWESEFHDGLVSRYALAVTRACRKNGCSMQVDLEPLPTIIDCDLCAELRGGAAPVCDYVMFLKRLPAAAVAVEMKAKVSHVRTAVQQIQAGAKFAERLAERCAMEDFYPVLLHQKGISAIEVKIVRNSRVQFRGLRVAVIYKRCGARLSDILGFKR